MTQTKRITGLPTLWRIGEPAPSGPYVASVPGTLAPLLPVDLPEKLRGFARETVAQRQMVEHLSLASSGFEMGPFTPKGAKLWTKALVVDSDLATAWRNGLHPGCIAMAPDYLLLPTAPDLWVIEVLADTILARLGPEDGFAAEPDLALALLSHAVTPKAILRLGPAHSDLDQRLSELNIPILTNPSELKKAGFTPLRWTDALGGLDLKDPPSALYDRLRDKIGRWRVTAICGMLAVLVWSGTFVLETRQLRAQTATDRQITQGLVREHFVQNGPILDVRAQVTAMVQTAMMAEPASAETLSPLTEFQRAASVLTHENLRLITASYRMDTGLVTSVEAVDFAALDHLTDALRAAGFVVDQLDSRTQQGGGVAAQLRLELAP